MLGVALLTAAWCAVAAPARASYGARTIADEPQYLLSAMSLAEDLDLDISDELSDQRWREFHEGQLPEQTKPVDDGRRFSPHDPLLPVVLAVPMAVGGWLGAKLALAALAGALAAALVWVAVRRFAVPAAVAALVTLAFSLTSPLSAYGTQVYPELPAALVLTVAVGALTGALDRRGRWVLGAAVVALPWLAVKYAPVAAVLALVALVHLVRTGRRRPALVLAGVLGAAAVLFLGAHQLLYGGWTAYAAGDHFVGGELTVAGTSPDVIGRSARLVGLLVDRNFGLAAWSPAILVAVPALGALVRRRPPGWTALAVPLVAGWLTATFVALTMHGYWWPGRQTVVVLPAAVLATTWWVARARSARPWLAGASAFGLAAWAWVVFEALTLRLRLVIDFDATTNPMLRAWRLMLPDYGQRAAADWARHGLWIVVLALLGAAGWRSARPRSAFTPSPSKGDRSTMARPTVHDPRTNPPDKERNSNAHPTSAASRRSVHPGPAGGGGL